MTSTNLQSFDTLALACFRLTLLNYRTNAYIGALAREHHRKQPLTVTVDVWVKKTPLSDDLANAYDYRALPQAVETELATGHIELQETLIERVADRLLADSRVQAVRVVSTKPEAYPNCDGIRAEIHRVRSAD